MFVLFVFLSGDNYLHTSAQTEEGWGGDMTQ